MPDKPTSDSPNPPDVVTADALRHGIDRGGAADKVAFPDPAAAPLGTDDEAAGFPPTREQVRMAAASELGPRPAATEETGAIPKLIRHRYAPVILALSFGLALLLVLLD
ncbi:MAG: hypothetical protein CFE34_13925 [Rhodobacteraceae bacterium PARR1]|nr:MAG: hypothetical protein CFE34_13925 [Rhodobacteraceae bacterium PARR1]